MKAAAAQENIFGAHPFSAVLALSLCRPGARAPLRFAPGFVGPPGLLGGHPPVLRARPPLGAALGFRGPALRGQESVLKVARLLPW